MEIGENLSRPLRDTYQIYLASCSNLGLGNFPRSYLHYLIWTIDKPYANQDYDSSKY